MRQIEYIFIDSDSENHGNKSGNNDLPGFRYHFIVNREGIVINTIDISQPGHLELGTQNLEPREVKRLNACSIGIKFNGSLKPETCNLKLRAKLLRLLVELRERFPNAKILGGSELDITSSHAPVRVNPKMNELRKELSNIS